MKTLNIISQKTQGLKSLIASAIIGLASTTASAQSLAPITAAQVHNTAMTYVNYSFNINASQINYYCCTFSGNPVGTPTWVHPGANNGFPYMYGGFCTPAQLTAHLSGGGQLTTNAWGVDCSGFVSRCWGLPTHHGTGQLPLVSTPIAATAARPGDALNNACCHVMLVDDYYHNGYMTLIQAYTHSAPVTRSQVSPVNRSGYTTIRRHNIVQPTCPNNYATLPYSTSFENQWLNDACSMEAERLPDVHWKSSIIGGSTTGGNDYWHRNDYTGFDWTSHANGAYTPSASNGKYSARFHNSVASANTNGALDLCVNLSPSGVKTISFDYMHHQPTYFAPFTFKVLLSTDGGLTFPTVLHTITVLNTPNWITQTFTTSAISAHSVIRFLILDKGTQDVGIDNLSIQTGLKGGKLASQNPTSIIDASEVEDMQIFPNPNNGSLLNINMPKSETNTYGIALFDIQGREVMNKTVNQENTDIALDMSETKMIAGIYFVIVNNGSKQFKKKLIVN